MLHLFRPKLSDVVKVEVLATHPMTRLTMQVVNKGNIFISENFEIKESKSFSFDFKPTLLMVPKCNVIVYYITQDGEIVSDSVEVPFEKELKNHVSHGKFKPESPFIPEIYRLTFKSQKTK